MINLINLGEIHYFSGDNRTALRLEEEALGEARSLGNSTNEAVSLNELGLILEALEDWSAAERRYTEAREISRILNAPALEHEAVAGLAHCALAQGRLEEARQGALVTWEYLEEHGAVNMEHPMRPYGLCADVFDALGERDLAQEVVDAGYRELMHRAEKISDSEWRESFLQEDPFNREIVELWEEGR